MAADDAIFGPLRFIEADLETRFQRTDSPRALTEAMRYALLSGGKRIRPLLVWHSCAAVGPMPERALPAAAAVEFIHAFSLVHDDLPAIDNDDLRRGRPTLHRHAGEGMAILAGDAMLAGAFDILAAAEMTAQGPFAVGLDIAARALSGTVAAAVEQGERTLAEPVLRLALLREVSEATLAMISGQIYDTLGGLPPSLSPIEQLRLVHTRKTGALIRASCRMGALCGLPSPCGPAAELAAITRFGESIGLMFQIVDDLLDVEQSSEHTGKRTGKDANAGKLTYPTVLGVAQSRAEVERLRREAHESLSGLGTRADNLRALADFLANRTK